MKAFLSICWSFIFIGFFCELGQMLTNQFDMFNIALGRCNWYLFPNQFQRIFSISMATNKRPTVITGYGNIECKREAFKKVNLSISFYWKVQRYCQRIRNKFLKNKSRFLYVFTDHFSGILLFYGTPSYRQIINTNTHKKINTFQAIIFAVALNPLFVPV